MWRLAIGAALLGLVACCSQKGPEATAPVAPVQEVAPPVEPPPAPPPSYHRQHIAHKHRAVHHRHRRKHHTDMWPPADSPPK